MVSHFSTTTKHRVEEGCLREMITSGKKNALFVWNNATRTGLEVGFLVPNAYAENWNYCTAVFITGSTGKLLALTFSFKALCASLLTLSWSWRNVPTETESGSKHSVLSEGTSGIRSHESQQGLNSCAFTATPFSWTWYLNADSFPVEIVVEF